MSKTVATTPGERNQPEEPTEQATLRIRTSPLDIKMSAQGVATQSVALGVIGPAATIAVGRFAGFPVWAVIVIVALQVLAAAFQHRRE